MTRLRVLLVGLLASAGILLVASPAQAAGAVANSCAVTAPVQVAKKAPGGAYMSWLGCGQGTSNVWWATVQGHPFYVKVYGAAPFCMKPGQLFYPNNSGYERTAILTPTVRC